jgi:hypothetical protein
MIVLGISNIFFAMPNKKVGMLISMLPKNSKSDCTSYTKFGNNIYTKYNPPKITNITNKIKLKASVQDCGF